MGRGSNRKKNKICLKSRLNKSSVLIGRIFCAERGCAFGLKACHSNDKYKKVAWQRKNNVITPLFVST